MLARKMVLPSLMALQVVAAFHGLGSLITGMPHGGLLRDWRVFYAAGRLILMHQSPYHLSSLHAMEQQAFFVPGPMTSGDLFVNPPVVAGFLSPLALLPFAVSFGLMTLISTAILVVATRWWARTFEMKHSLNWTFVLLLAWPTVWMLALGQLDAVLLACLSLSAWAGQRKAATPAGFFAILGFFIKPHLLWLVPCVLLAYFLATGQARRFLISAVATTAGFLALGEVLLPGGSGQFVHALQSFTNNLGSQADVISLSGMVGYPVAFAVIGCCLSVGLIATEARGRHVHQLLTVVGPFVLAVWMVFSPYAHPNDLVLCYPLFLWVMSRPLTENLRTALLAAAWFFPTIEALHLVVTPIVPVLLMFVLVVAAREILDTRVKVGTGTAALQRHIDHG